MTSKPLATISYNSDGFLRDTLNSLLSAGTISYYAYIHHEPDSDDREPHWHVRVVPNKLIDVVKFQRLFDEYVPDNDKPLGTILWRHSDESNWYLYGEHNELYLRAKNMSRNHTYGYNDFVVSDKREFDFQYNSAIEYLHSVLARDFLAEDELKGGVKLSDLAERGLITSKNAFRMRQYDDIVKRRIKDINYARLQDMENSLRNEFDEVHKERIKLAEIRKWYELNKDNPFMKIG